MRSIFEFPESGMELAADQSYAFGDVVIKIQELDKKNKKLIYAVQEGQSSKEVTIPYDEVGSIRHNGKILFSIRENSETGAVKIKPNSKGIKFARDLNSTSMRAAIAENLKKHKKTLLDIAQLEQDESTVNSSKKDGYTSSKALEGYAALCELYLYAKHEGLKSEERKALSSLINELLELADKMSRWESLERLVFNECFNNKPSSMTVSDVHDITKDKIKKITEKDTKALIKTGRLAIPFGFSGGIIFTSGGEYKVASGHHELAEMTFKGDDKGVGSYEITIYNAGYGSEQVGSQVESKVTYILNIKNYAEAMAFIELINLRQVIGDEGVTQSLYKEIMDEINATKGRKVRANKATPQTRGNCTTRSTREFAEDKVPAGLFSNIYRFLSNPERLEQMLDSMSKGLSMERRTAGNVVAFKDQVDQTIQGHIIRNNFQHVVDLLDAKKAKAMYKFRGASTTLAHIAVTLGNEKLLKKCLDLGFLGNEVDGAGTTLLVHANQSGKQNLVKLIVDNLKAKNRQDLLNVANTDGLSPLMAALQNDRLDEFATLIENGASIDPAKNGGYIILNLIVHKIVTVDANTDQANQNRYFSLLAKVLEKNPNFDLTIKDGQDKSFAYFAIAMVSFANEDDAIVQSLIKSLARSLVANFKDNLEIRQLVETILVKTKEYDSPDIQPLALLYLKNSAKWKDSDLFNTVACNYFCEAIKSKDSKMLDQLVQIPEAKKFIENHLDILISYNKEIKDANPDVLIALLDEFPIKGANPKDLQNLLKANFSAEIGERIFSHAKFLDSKSESKDSKAIVDGILAKEKQVDLVIQERKEEAKVTYQFGDFLRSFFSLLTGIEATRGEDAYHIGDFLRGGIAWATGDDSWRRKVKDESKSKQQGAQQSSSWMDFFGGSG